MEWDLEKIKGCASFKRCSVLINSHKLCNANIVIVSNSNYGTRLKGLNEISKLRKGIKSIFFIIN